MSAGLAYAAADVGYEDPVVRAADLEVHPGEMVGLVGPNGAGKTTLLRAVTGGARVLAGEVTVGGRGVRSYRQVELARLVGVLPQSAPAAFAFEGRRFVEMGRHARGSRFGGLGEADRAAVERAMELTGTSDLADRAVDTLSGGDLQRLTLAQTLAQEPVVLLLDEPTSHLDLNHRLQVLDVVRGLADGGMAVLAVFHDLDMAARYADRLAVVSAGRVSGAAAPEAVLTAKTMSEVFGVRAVIGRDVVTGAVQILPVVRVGESAAPRGVRVLVISGSGSGASVMRRLAVGGFEVRTGALAKGDTDEQIAASIDADIVAMAPFGAMGPADEAAVRAAAAESDAVVVVATPFGPANVGNLRAVAGFARRTVLVGELGPDDDFSDGEATRVWSELARAGAVRRAEARDAVAGIEEVLAR